MPYDVAFSLKGEDEKYARSIQNALPSEISSFLYSTSKRKLIMRRDLLNAFPEVFREARLCVILYREGWGKTPWTRLEERTLSDRYREEGSDFLMLLRMDTTAEIPAWFPVSDMWVDYLGEGPEKTALYVSERLNAQTHNRSLRITAHSFGRRPVPIARYQKQIQKYIVCFEAVRPEICDACTSCVEYRPMVRVTLPSYGGFPSCQEQLCPICARERGIKVSIPRGMAADAVYSKANPSYGSHVQRLLGFPILPSLSPDKELKSLGVTNVGAVGGGTMIELIVSLADQPPLKIDFSLYELEKMDLKADWELMKYFKETIVASLQNAI